MKFTKEQAYENIVAKLTSHGEKLDVSERSINEHLETLMKNGANEETELEAFVDMWLPIFKTTDNNARDSFSKGMNKEKENNPTPKEEHKEKVKLDSEKEPSAFEQRLMALEEENKRQKREIFVSSKKKEISSALREKGVKNEKWINSLLDEINIGEDFDVEAKTQSYVNLYNSMQAEMPEGTTPKTPKGNKDEYALDVIKQASQLAHDNNLVGY